MEGLLCPTRISRPGTTSVKMLSRLIRREKLGIDPALQATALDLNPVPIPACNSKACAFGGCPKNRPVCRWRRPDVYAGTLQQNGISVFGRRDSWARPGGAAASWGAGSKVTEGGRSGKATTALLDGAGDGSGILGAAWTGATGEGCTVGADSAV